MIQLDNYAASRALAHHLLSYGHQKFAAIVGQVSSQIYRERLSGIRSVLEEEGIPFGDSQITGGAYTIEAGIAGVEYLLAQPVRPTAIFCFNDDIAIGAVHALKKAGLRVPQDISVVGFDNIKVSAFVDPPLTTIDQPAYDMGRRAVEVLLSQIRGEPLLRNKEVLPFRLIERDSVAPAKG